MQVNLVPERTVEYTPEEIAEARARIAEARALTLARKKRERERATEEEDAYEDDEYEEEDEVERMQRFWGRLIIITFAGMTFYKILTGTF